MRQLPVGLCILLVMGSHAYACDLPSPADAAKAAFVKPIEAEATLGFGLKYHPVLRYVRPHNGIDFAARIGEPVAVVLGGIVIDARYKGEFGNVVMVDHGAGLTSSYSHLSRYAPGLAADTCVRPGDVIGYVGNTGLSASPHLHLEVHLHGQPIDPAPLLGLIVPPAEPTPLPPKLRN